VPLAALESLAEDIERELGEASVKEVESKLIGERLLPRLRVLDEVAYVRFASVYRQFDDVGEFQRELELLDAERTSVR
jgi:transcriptional repressor NrdR